MFTRIGVGTTFLGLCCAFALAETGRLSVGDAQLESGEYYDLHVVEGQAGGVLSVALASGEFDPYLIVLGPDDAELVQIDDTEGLGLNVRVDLPLPASGSYTLVVTSAFPGESGSYELEVAGSSVPADANPLAPRVEEPAVAPTANPLARTVIAEPFAGAFVGSGMSVELVDAGEELGGTLVVGGSAYDLLARVDGSTLEGTFARDGQSFPFSASLRGDTLTLESGGGRHVLLRRGTVEPVAVPDVPAPEDRVPAQDVAAAPPRPNIGARPGFVTGTVFDTFGRPLSGAGVLISGTTYTQGQRTQFETVTGNDGTYAVRVPDGRYKARAWIDVAYEGILFSRIVHPLSGNANTEVDSVDGGTLDFQWRLTGLVSPPGDDPSDYYGASIDFTYCGLPADAYCAPEYDAFPNGPIAHGGSTVRVTLTPTAALIDGSQGRPLTFEFDVEEQDPDYPYGGAPNAPAGYETGGGGRTTLGADWPYHSSYLHDIPIGVYEMSATAVLPDGQSFPLRLGLAPEDVEHPTVRVSFSPWEGFQGRSYSGGGIEELDVYVRD